MKMMSKTSSSDKGLKAQLEESLKTNQVLNASIAALEEANTALSNEVDGLKKGKSPEDKKIEAQMNSLKKDLAAATK